MTKLRFIMIETDYSCPSDLARELLERFLGGEAEDQGPAQPKDEMTAIELPPAAHRRTRREKTLPEPADEPAPAAPAAAKKGRQRQLWETRSGKVVTTKEAAELAGCTDSYVYCKAKDARNDWFSVSGTELRRARAVSPSAPELDPGGARPRHSFASSQPRNPNVIGGGATIGRPEERN